jgi:hypothetical protein
MDIRIINLLVIKGMPMLKINLHAKCYTQCGYRQNKNIFNTKDFYWQEHKTLEWI